MNLFHHRHDLAAFAREVLGFHPDAGQLVLICSVNRRVILNCRRQWGKSTLAAIFAIHRAFFNENQRVVLISTTMRQSRELAAKCRSFALKLGVPLGTDGTNPRSIVFPNGSIILPLPAHSDHVRGFTANLIIIDEAARVSDEVITAATPMLATTEGDLWLLSTPKGKRGLFYEVWTGSDSEWLRVEGKASDGSGARVSKGFFESEKKWMRAEEYAAEHECEFATADRNVFSEAWLEAAFTSEVVPFDELSRTDLQFVRHRPVYYVALDLAGVSDHAALVILEFRAIPTGTRDPATYQHLYRRSLNVVGIERFRRGTQYREVMARVSRLCRHPHLEGHAQLLVEANGPGLPVIQLLRDERLPVNLLPITTTGGSFATVSANGRSVPKKELIAVLELLLERGILKIAASLPHADLLREELRQFERWSTRGGNFQFGAGRGHDDLVMALAIACWWAWTNRRHLLLGPELKPLD